MWRRRITTMTVIPVASNKPAITATVTPTATGETSAPDEPEERSTDAYVLSLLFLLTHVLYCTIKPKCNNYI